MLCNGGHDLLKDFLPPCMIVQSDLHGIITLCQNLTVGAGMSQKSWAIIDRG